MKSANKSRQNPELAPPNAVPGFQLFEDKASGLYYFSCGDVHGKPVFFSQAYNARDNASSGLQTAIRNAAKPRQFKTCDEGGSFYFTLHAGNHQEIGRSITFDDADKMLMAVSYLQQVAQSEQPIAEIPEKSNAKARGAELAPPVVSASKYAFRIDYYEADKGKTPKGRIEHLQSGDSMALQGLHPEVIGNFIQTRLPAAAAIPTVSAAAAAELHICKHPWGAMPSAAPLTNALVEFDLSLPSGRRSVSRVDLELKAYIIGEKSQVNLAVSAVPVTEQGHVEFVLPAAYFVPGLYRVQATASTSATEQWSAECLMSVL